MLHQFATRHVRCVPRSSAQTSWPLLCAVYESRRTLVWIAHAAGRGTAQHRHGEQSFHFSYCHILSYTCTEDVRADPMVMKENSRAEAAPTRARQVRDAKRRPAGAGRPCCAACIHQLVQNHPSAIGAGCVAKFLKCLLTAFFAVLRVNISRGVIANLIVGIGPTGVRFFHTGVRRRKII